MEALSTKSRQGRKIFVFNLDLFLLLATKCKRRQGAIVFRGAIMEALSTKSWQEVRASS